MKKAILLFLTALLLLQIGCKPPTGASNTTAETTVDIWGYLGLCSSFFEGEKNVRVRISVDQYNSAGTLTANFKNYSFVRKNKDDFSKPEDYQFKVEVPQSGTYAVTVEVFALDCYKCCQGSCTSYFPAWGYPSWRGVSVKYNTFPPPPKIIVTLSRVSCD